MIPTGFRLPDLTVTLSAFLLLSLGIVVIYSSDPQLAWQQFGFAVIGFLLYGLISSINFEYFQHYWKPAYIITLVLLGIVLLLGIESRGSIRWIPVGPFRFQPSEFAKPVLILVLAYFWSVNPPNWKNIAKSALYTAPIFFLIFRQPDLGTALTLAVIWISMLVAANVSFVKLGIMAGTFLTILPIGWLFLHDYQKNRIFSFLSPTNDPLGVGYNVIQSTIAVGSGQIMGRGLGRGTQSRLQFLPEFRTDFIFASIAEELGFLGSALLLALYGFMMGRSLRIAGQSSSRFGGLLVVGVLGMLFFQIVVNIGMNIGVLPITGITLPLVSYGGSSVIATLICLGMVASVARFAHGGMVVSRDLE